MKIDVSKFRESVKTLGEANRKLEDELSVNLMHGDCLERMRELADNSVDSIVTDPPYGLSFMGKKWDVSVPSVEIWKEALRVLKPGGHLLAFSGTRTYHHLAMNIELAGFEIRDQLQWIYGQGFPKSHDISKAIDKDAGAEREKIRYEWKDTAQQDKPFQSGFGDNRPWIEKAKQQGFYEAAGTEPVTDAAKKWNGWGTALKPANEPIVLAQKPLWQDTIAKNVLEHGVGGLNIDACRISTTDKLQKLNGSFSFNSGSGANEKNKTIEFVDAGLGRFPSNVLLDEEAAELLDEQVKGKLHAPGNKNPSKAGQGKNVKYNTAGLVKDASAFNLGGDPTKASRFFYVAKASPSERGDNSHPTVKPVALMEYLIKLVTPPRGTVLEPFMGSGTTGVAAKRLRFNFVGIELDKKYFDIAKNRIERTRPSV